MIPARFPPRGQRRPPAGVSRRGHTGRDPPPRGGISRALHRFPDSPIPRTLAVMFPPDGQALQTPLRHGSAGVRRHRKLRGVSRSASDADRPREYLEHHAPGALPVARAPLSSPVCAAFSNWSCLGSPLPESPLRNPPGISEKARLFGGGPRPERAASSASGRSARRRASAMAPRTLRGTGTPPDRPSRRKGEWTAKRVTLPHRLAVWASTSSLPRCPARSVSAHPRPLEAKSSPPRRRRSP